MACNLGLDYNLDCDFYKEREYTTNSSLKYHKKFHIKSSVPYYPNQSACEFDSYSKEFLIKMVSKDLMLFLIENDFVKITETVFERVTYGTWVEMTGEVMFKFMEPPRRFKKKIIIEKKDGK
jgi:hypothetical protein